MRALADDIQTDECKTALDCKGPFGTVIDVCIGIKALVLITMNLQSFLWWRNHKSVCYTITIRLMLLVSNVIIIIEFAFRFTDKELKPLFVLVTLANWLVLFSQSVLVRLEFPWKDNPHNYAFMLLIPFHIAYLVVFILGFIDATSTEVTCGGSVLYPPIMLANDGLFFALYIFTIILHFNGYFKRWDLDIMPDEQVTYDSFVYNEE